jgi:hypothetical protein
MWTIYDRPAAEAAASLDVDGPSRAELAEDAAMYRADTTRRVREVQAELAVKFPPTNDPATCPW